MDYNIIEEIEKTEKLLDGKCAQYKGVAGMEEYIKFLEETRLNLLVNGLMETVTEDYLKSIHTDIEFEERSALGHAGLLPPEEQEAWDKLRAFLLGPCDLPPEVQ